MPLVAGKTEVRPPKCQAFKEVRIQNHTLTPAVNFRILQLLIVLHALLPLFPAPYPLPLAGRFCPLAT